MDIRQLETYVAVCKRKSFSAAAKELYISQPSVTNHIQSLEYELGATFVVRSSHNITLTQQGIALYEFAKKTISEKNKMCSQIASLNGDFKGVLEIAASTVPELVVLPHLIKKFNELYPHVIFKLHHMDSGEVIECLENKKFYFGFCGCKKTKSVAEFRKIASDRMVIIEGKNSGFIKSDHYFLSPNDIWDLPLIMREEGSGSKSLVLHSLLNKKNINVVAEVDTDQVIKRMVSKGIGISIISINSLSKEEQKAYNVYEILNQPLERDLYFAYNPGGLLSMVEQKFVEMCLNEVGVCT